MKSKEELIEGLRYKIDESAQYSEDGDDASFRHNIGVLLTRNNAIAIVQYLSESSKLRAELDEVKKELNLERILVEVQVRQLKDLMTELNAVKKELEIERAASKIQQNRIQELIAERDELKRSVFKYS